MRLLRDDDAFPERAITITAVFWIAIIWAGVCIAPALVAIRTLTAANIPVPQSLYQALAQLEHGAFINGSRSEGPKHPS
jgi:hypothetical protein